MHANLFTSSRCTQIGPMSFMFADVRLVKDIEFLKKGESFPSAVLDYKGGTIAFDKPDGGRVLCGLRLETGTMMDVGRGE